MVSIYYSAALSYVSTTKWLASIVSYTVYRFSEVIESDSILAISDITSLFFVSKCVYKVYSDLKSKRS